MHVCLQSSLLRIPKMKELNNNYTYVENNKKTDFKKYILIIIIAILALSAFIISILTLFCVSKSHKDEGRETQTKSSKNFLFNKQITVKICGGDCFQREKNVYLSIIQWDIIQILTRLVVTKYHL